MQGRNVFEARKWLLDSLAIDRVHDQSFPFAVPFESKTAVNVTRTPNPRAEALSSDLSNLSWAAQMGYLEMVVEPVLYFSALDG